MTRKKAKPKFVSSGTCYCYLRVSSKRQGESGGSLKNQEKQCLRMAKIARLSLGIACCDLENRTGLFVDIDQSAWRKRFDERPAGKALLKTVQPGDSIIVHKIDRAFRSMTDFCLTSTAWTEAGIRLILCQPQLDLGTAHGRATAHFIAAMAEWESSRRSERIIAALKAKKAREGIAKTFDGANGKLTVEQQGSDWRPVEAADKPEAAPIPGTIYFYTRCSHRDSVESGLGLFAQLDQARAYAEVLTESNPELKSGILYTDPAVSASRHEMRSRHYGKILLDTVKAGDHIVFASLDRGFRDLKDLSTELWMLARQGVTMHFVQEGLSTASDSGKIFIQFAGIFAENEARMASERAIESRAQLTSEGRWAGGFCPTFWQVYKVRIGSKMVKKLVVREEKVEAFEMVAELINNEKMTIVAACAKVEEIFAERQGRPAIPPGGCAKCSKMSGALPEGYPRDELGRAFPIWTERCYRHAKKRYPNARAALDKRRRVVEDLREKFGPPRPDKPVKLNQRGWPLGQNIPMELRGLVGAFDLEYHEEPI